MFPHNLIVCASSEKQKSRWQKVGIPCNRVHNLGNLKIDISPITPTSLDKRNFRKKELGFPASSIVITGISTWPGEEKMLLEILQEMRSLNFDARLLIIPRHAERKNDILEVIKRYSFSYQQRSLQKKTNLENIVYLGDTTGELTQLTEAGDIAFLGKTLPPRHEGQNPIEPVAMGMPLILGPRCTNFQEICDELLTCGAALQGVSAKEIKEIFHDLFKNSKKAKEMSRAGVEWRNAQGSPSRNTVQTLQKFL
jgi:3-deoxy-D-manno-octulosonic-acid transferase